MDRLQPLRAVKPAQQKSSGAEPVVGSVVEKSYVVQHQISLSKQRDQSRKGQDNQSPARKCRAGEGKESSPEGTAQDYTRPNQPLWWLDADPNLSFPIRVAAAVCPINSTPH